MMSMLFRSAIPGPEMYKAYGPGASTFKSFALHNVYIHAYIHTYIQACVLAHTLFTRETSGTRK